LHAYQLSFSLGEKNYDIRAAIDDEWQTLMQSSIAG